MTNYLYEHAEWIAPVNLIEAEFLFTPYNQSWDT